MSTPLPPPPYRSGPPPLPRPHHLHLHLQHQQRPPTHQQHQQHQHQQARPRTQQQAPRPQTQQQRQAPPSSTPLPPQAHGPKTILLVNPARESHGLVKQLGQMADVTRLSPQLAPADAVFSHRNRSIGLLILSYPELRSHFARVLDRVKAFHAKSSQHPVVVLISPRRDQTPPEWFTLQEEAPLGRLHFLLACDLPDATAGVEAVLGVVKDDGRRQRQNNWFLELARSAASPGAAEGVLKGLWGALRLDEKELWRLLSAEESLRRIANANAEQLLRDCPIDRRTARVLCDFLDGRVS